MRERFAILVAGVDAFLSDHPDADAPDVTALRDVLNAVRADDSELSDRAPRGTPLLPHAAAEADAAEDAEIAAAAAAASALEAESSAVGLPARRLLHFEGDLKSNIQHIIAMYARHGIKPAPLSKYLPAAAATVPTR